jgi:anionic cell wall polymer biosynthesis LytR-Cps2A-Psr (LCP) family protein
MKRIILYASAPVVLGLFLAALTASCSNGPVTVDTWSGPTLPEFMPSNFPLSTEAFLAAPTERTIPTLMPSFTPEGPQVWNYLVLGGDMGPGRPQDVSGGAGDKTDVILLVTVRDTEPMHITITQFPRNLYSSAYLPDRLLFEVYWQDGFEGMRTYFGDVFGVELDGIAYVDMAHFVDYVDRLGGVLISREAMGCEPGSSDASGMCYFDGAELLAWLRDNDNNWEHGVYDAGMRQHRALVAILDKVHQQNTPASLADAYDFYSQGIETDLSVVEFADAAFVALRGIKYGMVIDYDRLAYPTIARGDVPVKPGRAEVANGVSLKDWMQGVLR